MIKIEDSLITQVLPDCISDTAEVRAIAYALNNQVRKMIKYIYSTIIIPNVDNLGNEILDALALELRVHYYDDKFPLSIKRDVVKKSLARYEVAGTKQVVEELVSLVFGKGVIQEWFEYGGDPGKFKITVDNGSIADTKSTEFLQLLNSIKRKSAHLDVLEIGETSIKDIKYGIASHDVTTIIYKESRGLR